MRYSPVYSSSGIRAVESAAQSGAGAPRLMERAGLAAAEHARRVMSERSGAVLVVAGPGNNGGDAFEVAAHLKRLFYRVDTLFAGESSRLPADAVAAMAKWTGAGGECLREFPAGASRRYGLVIDGLFGIGLARPLAGTHGELVGRINSCGVPVLALDVPSGLNADTGAVMGTAVRAAHTITFIALKPGLLTLDGPDYCGALRVDALGLNVEALAPAPGRLLSEAAIRAALAPRPRNYHKGKAGSVAVLGGAPGMVGAALLAARAALACGAGRVYAGLLDPRAAAVDVLQPELMLRSAADAPLEDSVLALGPGLGRDEPARELLHRALALASPAVIDADALNLIASDAELAARAAGRGAATILTPHPAEAARLLGCETRAVQSDRIAAAQAIAGRFRALVALKGNGTVVADAEANWWINPTGQPGMASAGMGDALTGMVASLLAQGAEPLAALCAGVWLHGAAGEAVAASHGGALGTTASEVIEEARGILNRHMGD